VHRGDVQQERQKPGAHLNHSALWSRGSTGCQHSLLEHQHQHHLAGARPCAGFSTRHQVSLPGVTTSDTPWGPAACLQVELPMDELAGYSVATPALSARYKYKNLRAALAQIPTGGGKAAGSISTKVWWLKQGWLDESVLSHASGVTPVCLRLCCDCSAPAPAGVHCVFHPFLPCNLKPCQHPRLAMCVCRSASMHLGCSRWPTESTWEGVAPGEEVARVAPASCSPRLASAWQQAHR
jgi:hypothetical protein